MSSKVRKYIGMVREYCIAITSAVNISFIAISATINTLYCNIYSQQYIDCNICDHQYIVLQYLESTIYLLQYLEPTILMYFCATLATGTQLTKPRNPQTNSVCDRMHQAIGNTLRVLTTIELPQGAAEVEQLVDTAIADAVYAARCSYHSALKSTPGSVAFGQDMILNIPIITDLQQLQKRRQELVNKRLIEANAKRFAYDYAVWERVLRLVYHTDKLDPSAVGPYTITQVHAIGTLTIEVSSGVVERSIIRHVKSYRR
jgi:hypothetical protein